MIQRTQELKREKINNGLKYQTLPLDTESQLKQLNRNYIMVFMSH